MYILINVLCDTQESKVLSDMDIKSDALEYRKSMIFINKIVGVVSDEDGKGIIYTIDGESFATNTMFDKLYKFLRTNNNSAFDFTDQTGS